MGHLQPVPPDLAEHAAQHVAVLTAQNKIDREIVGQTGGADIVVVDAVHNELPRAFVDERLEPDPRRCHHALELSRGRLEDRAWRANRSAHRRACFNSPYPPAAPALAGRSTNPETSSSGSRPSA